MDTAPAKREKRPQSQSPPVPIKTYRWEDVRRARRQGGYPWTHLDKPGLDDDAMSGRRTPIVLADQPQKILSLESSPGSSRKLADDDAVHIPHFSKEISLESEEEAPAVKVLTDAKVTAISPRSILKRKHDTQPAPEVDDSPRNSKCCHPLVDKIKHIADKTIHKPGELRPVPKPKEQPQEILELDNSPGTERRERRKAAELERLADDKVVHVSMVMRDDTDADATSGDSKDPSLTIDEPPETDGDDATLTQVKSMYDTAMKPPEPDAEDPARKVHFEKDADAADADADDFWSKMGDHEYEPIGQPASEREVTPEPEEEEDVVVEEEVVVTPPTVIVVEPDTDAQYERASPHEDDASSIASHERRLLRTDAEDIPDTSDTASPTPFSSKQDSYFETPESRTDNEISTSQVDSSALENLPLKKESRKRSGVSAEANKLQQRIKNQTGKLKTKLKSIKKPQFRMPERPKFEAPKFNLPERPKFNLPERPKFNLPERPKFNLPERPKFNLPERPKFNLPERPKFNLPERPKFNLPERPKFNLPERPKINLPDRSKFRLPERPKFLEGRKFSLPERPKFTMPDRSKFKIPDKAKAHLASLGRSKSSQSAEKTEKSTDSASTPKRRLIEFDFRTYPRFSKFKRDKKDAKADRPGTPPPAFATVPRSKDRKAIINATHWQDPSDRSAGEDPRQYGTPREYPSQSDRDFQLKLARVDKDYDQMQEEYERERLHLQNIAKAKLENAELWNAMEKSSVQRLEEHRVSLPCYLPGNDQNNNEFEQAAQAGDDASSGASNGHRRGVLEEIDNDEFFLRQKGISQDNIEVGRYLSDEIRDAFRSPMNALDQMETPMPRSAYIEVVDVDSRRFDSTEVFVDNAEDAFMDDDVDQQQDMIEHDDGYYTFPPVRPSRSRKTKPKEKESKPDIEVASAPPMTVQEAFVKLENEKNDAIRKTIFSSTFKEPEMLENLNEYENEVDQTKDMPTIPKRRKKTKDYNYAEDGDLFDESYEPEKVITLKSLNDTQPDNQVVVHRMEYVLPSADSEPIEESPIPPRRNRSRSRGSRTASACDDDRTSRGAESITLDSHTNLPTSEADFIDEEYPGYAMVEKVITQKKIEPPPRPPAPVRRRRSTKSLSGDRQFFTVPRSLKESTPPKRPTRTYSTLGPSRPPRKKSSTSLTNLKASASQISVDNTQYIEIDDDLDIHKALQSGEVVSKMKHRPLPPPPRPPRGPKKKRDVDDSKPQDDVDEVAIETRLEEPQEPISDRQISDSQSNADGDTVISIDRQIYVAEEPTEIDIELEPVVVFEFLADRADEYYDHEREIMEIEVSTQTDPLPDDFDYTIGMEDVLVDTQKDSRFEYFDEPEENSIDAEILSRGLQHFRETSRPASRGSRPRTPLDRMSPTAILVERRVSSPTRINETDVILTEASLTVVPIDEEDTRFFDSNVTETKPFEAAVETKIEPAIATAHAQSLFAPVAPTPKKTEPIETATPQKPEPTETTVPQKLELHETTVPQKSQLQETAVPQKLELHETTVPTPAVQPTSIEPPLVVAPQRTTISVDPEVEVLRTRCLQVSDLQVERLNVSELQASKILVSEIEGLSLQISDVNSESGNLVVRGIELAPGIFDDLLQKFSQLSPPSAVASTQTVEESPPSPASAPAAEPASEPIASPTAIPFIPESSPPIIMDDDLPLEMRRDVEPSTSEAPERPPLPQMPSVFPMGYFPECSMAPPQFYRLRPEDRSPPDFSDADPEADDGEAAARESSRRRKHKSPKKRSRSQTTAQEPSVAELSSQLFRACQGSMGRTLQYILTYITSQFNSGESKKDLQMALVIVLVMVAGLILLGVGDGRTVHHHHWDFYNPPNNDK